MNNIVYVLSAAVANFVLGWIWFKTLGKELSFTGGRRREDTRRKDPTPYLIAFIGSLWASYGIFLIMKHIRPQNFTELMTIALGLWVFILVGLGSKHYAFANKSIKRFLYDYGLDLVGVIVMTMILSNIRF